jgi:predicted HicB family RNase H-like nuclease
MLAPDMEPAMKRIIDGVTYNTETATKIARKRERNPLFEPGEFIEEEMYMTRGGAFFMTVRYPGDDQVEIYARRRSEVEHWLTYGSVDVFADILSDLPEAKAEPSAGATIYVRVPKILKNRLEATAEANDQSLNAWITRCLERCVASS